MNSAAPLRRVGDVLRSADLLTEVRGSEDIAVRGLALDSRAVRPGDLFLAWRGSRFDAHDFVPAAAAAGAVAAVVERPLDIDLPQLVVTNGRRAAALASSSVMGSPSRELKTVGVTGTNGKTTTALILRHLLAAEMPAAVIGTLGLVDERGVRPQSEGLTTPDPVQIAIWLRELVDGGVGAVVMEASSHALAQHRLDGTAFDVGVFTNLSQDHLDYHGDMDAYREAKTMLVSLVAPDGSVVVNADEAAWSGLDLQGRDFRTFGITAATADVRATEIELGARGSRFTLDVGGERHRIELPLVGEYNVANALAAVGGALAAGLPLDVVAAHLATVPQVSGRLEAIQTQPYAVLIDFAHTPAALEGALAAVRPLTSGKLIVVFGAGGDRDPTKRRPMGEAVARHADIAIVTSDNPRTEDPDVIIDGVVAGMVGADYQRVTDRKAAIRRALHIAEEGDTVVLAGKGHETYQVVGEQKIPFDEREIVRALLAGEEES